MRRRATGLRHNAATMRIPLMLFALATLLAACGSRPLTQKEQVKAAFDEADLNHDEQLVPDEFARLPLKGVDFAELDSDLNHTLSLAELESFLIYRRVKDDGNRALRELMRPRSR